MPELLNIAFRLAVFVASLYLVIWTLTSAVRAFILPRSQNVLLTRVAFRAIRLGFDFRLKRANTYEDRDRVMALYAPIALVALVGSWLFLTMLGYTGMFWTINQISLYEAFRVSGSSLFTLGFFVSDNFPSLILEFTEAGLGMLLSALLIAYLPTMYSAFQRREMLVNQLEVRAGEPPSAVEMILRAHRIRGLDALTPLWEQWEVWFVDVEESHTSLAPLIFFRSPAAGRSWVTSAGVVLDAAALLASTVDVPRSPQAELCIRSGYLTLREIADFFRIAYDPNPRPTDPISISRQEFDAVYDQLHMGGVPLKPDRDACWTNFSGWRVNYDRVLIALAALTMSPYAMWVSDRSLPRWSNVLPGTFSKRYGR